MAGGNIHNLCVDTVAIVHQNLFHKENICQVNFLLLQYKFKMPLFFTHNFWNSVPSFSYLIT